MKELERDRLIVRKEYPQIPPKVEYSLSERGTSLMAVLDQLCVLGENNRDGESNEYRVVGINGVVLVYEIMEKKLHV